MSGDLAALLITLTLLTLTYLSMSTISKAQLLNSLDFDIARLSTVTLKGVNSTKVYLVTVRPFSLNSTCKVVLFLSPFEVKTFKSELNSLIRTLSSNDVTVLLAVVKGPKWVMPPLGANADAGYCWGPSCPIGRVSFPMILDNPQGSYQFFVNVVSAYGSLGVLFSDWLLSKGLLYSRNLTQGVMLSNNTFLYLGDSLMPMYVYDTLKVSNLLLSLCKGHTK